MAPRLHRRSVLHGGLAATVVSGLGAAPALADDRPRVRRDIEEPDVFDTQEWEARSPSEEIVVEDRRPAYIVVHHTVEPGNTEDFSRERAFAISRAIQNHHMDGNGWIDSGQHFTISRGGYITEGRHRSLEILREGMRHVVGTNVGNHNSEVIGIENEGLYTEEDVTRMLWESLVDLVSYMSQQYEVPPENIKGHRDFNSTQCPGDRLYARLPELRHEVSQRRRLRWEPENRAEWPLLRPGDRGHQVLTAQRLLRDYGMRRVPADGVYGPATERAVADLAARHGLDRPTCAAGAHSDEAGFLGADIWPLIVNGDRSAAEWKRALATGFVSADQS